ncbi:MAG: hypothetical protein VYA34_13255 [Myxococcota bacterium]|nr:hypothetical protein [Myxococcota bacterium]
MEFFGQYLLREGVIDVEQLRLALELMDRENLRLGQVAIEAGFLTESQATDVNREQTSTDKPFGAICVSHGLISEVQLRDLLKLQNQRRVRLGESLVRLQYLKPNELVHHLRKYKTETEYILIHKRDLPGYLQNHRIAEFVLELIPRLTHRITRAQVRIPGHCIKNERLEMPCSASLLLRSEHGLRIALGCDELFARELTFGVFGTGTKDGLDKSLQNDAIGEFLCMVGGNSIAGLEQEGIPCDIDPPLLGIPPTGGWLFPLSATTGRVNLVLSQP